MQLVGFYYKTHIVTDNYSLGEVIFVEVVYVKEPHVDWCSLQGSSGRILPFAAAIVQVIVSEVSMQASAYICVRC